MLNTSSSILKIQNIQIYNAFFSTFIRQQQTTTHRIFLSLITHATVKSLFLRGYTNSNSPSLHNNQLTLLHQPEYYFHCVARLATTTLTMASFYALIIDYDSEGCAVNIERKGKNKGRKGSGHRNADIPVAHTQKDSSLPQEQRRRYRYICYY